MSVHSTSPCLPTFICSAQEGTQTSSSLQFRIAAAVIGIVTALIGLFVAHGILIPQGAPVVGWPLFAVGMAVAMIGFSIKWMSSYGENVIAGEARDLEWSKLPLFKCVTIKPFEHVEINYENKKITFSYNLRDEGCQDIYSEGGTIAAALGRTVLICQDSQRTLQYILDSDKKNAKFWYSRPRVAQDNDKVVACIGKGSEEQGSYTTLGEVLSLTANCSLNKFSIDGVVSSVSIHNNHLACVVHPYEAEDKVYQVVRLSLTDLQQIPLPQTFSKAILYKDKIIGIFDQSTFVYSVESGELLYKIDQDLLKQANNDDSSFIHPIIEDDQLFVVDANITGLSLKKVNLENKEITYEQLSIANAYPHKMKYVDGAILICFSIKDSKKDFVWIVPHV